MSQDALHGSKIGLLVNGFNLGAAFNDFGLEAMQETLDRTGFGSSARRKVSGLKDGKGSGGGWVDPTATTGSLAVFRALYAAGSPGGGTPASITRSLNSPTFVVGALIDLAYFNLASFSFQGVITDLEKLTISGEAADDGIDHGISLHPLTAETSFPFTGTVVDNAAQTTNGGVFVVHGIAIAGAAKSATIKVQHSTDNSTYVDLATATAITADNSVRRVEVAAGTTIRRYLKVVVTDTGTTSSCTFVAAFARR